MVNEETQPEAWEPGNSVDERNRGELGFTSELESGGVVRIGGGESVEKEAAEQRQRGAAPEPAGSGRSRGWRRRRRARERDRARKGIELYVRAYECGVYDPACVRVCTTRPNTHWPNKPFSPINQLIFLSI